MNNLIERRLRYSVKMPPNEYTYAGLSYESASRAAIEICKLGAETGQTINTSLHLDKLCEIMQAKGY